MNAFVDIKIIENPEIPSAVVMNSVFEEFHRRLVQFGEGSIAVSFPEYAATMGTVLRIHGPHDQLKNFMAQDWLKAYQDYVSIRAIGAIPQDCVYRSFYRVQKKSPANMRKRAVRRGRMTEQEAMERIPDGIQQYLRLPYLQLHSSSTNQTMRLYIRMSEEKPQSLNTKFSAYGLSRDCVVPWF